MSVQIQQAFVVNGQTFATKAEALNFVRRPLILAAMLVAVNNQEDVAEWLVDNQDTVESAFESGTIRRVTKSDYNKLEKALAEITSGFLFDNSKAVLDSFRWPAVKRLTAEEKVEAAKTQLLQASNNPELADYVVANSAAILEAYSAGVEKREVSPKAAAGLAEYQAKKRAEEDAEAEAKGPEAVAELAAKREANRLKREAKAGK